MADFFEEVDDEQEQEDNREFENQRDHIVFLIDARQNMLVKAGELVQGFTADDTWLSISLKIVKAILKGRIIGSSTDQIAVIFYGTANTKNDSKFERVYVLQDLEEGSARRLREIDDVIASKFEQDIGSATEGNSTQDLMFGLWVAGQQLQRSSAGVRRNVQIMTNDEGPAQADNPDLKDAWDKVMARSVELRESGTDIDFLPMIPSSEKRKTSQFWVELLDLEGEKANDTEDGSMLLNLATVERFKEYKKRPLRKAKLQFGSVFGIDVQLFKMFRKADKGKKFQLHAVTNDELITESALLDQDTGHVLTKSMLTKVAFPKPAVGNKVCRFPQALFTTEEADEIKRVQAEGIHILGFKPMQYMRDYHNLREPTFIYPSEKELGGSTTAFIALHTAMVAEDRFAVASAVLGKSAAPQLVALVAQEEVRDEGGQVVPPGFQMITLPWSDDIRQPEADTGFVGNSPVSAEEAQIEAAEKMIEALQLPSDWYSSSVSNPTLQRHFQVLEARALAEDPGPQPDDDTMPNEALISAADPAIQAFYDAIHVAGKPKALTARAGAKRKAPELGPEVNWKELATQGGLDSLTIPQLKEYCDANKLKKGGKKGDLVERIKDHLGC